MGLEGESRTLRLVALAGMSVLVVVLLLLPSSFVLFGGTLSSLSAGGYRLSGVTEVQDTIRVLMPDGTVRTMDMDEYLKGVVPAEVGPSWPYDSLSAQAVAARSFAATADRHPEQGADVCTTTHCQVWRDVHYESTDIAVDSTHKVAALYQGEIISAFYFGHCDGHTRNSEDVWGGFLPYCRSVPCPCGFTYMYGHGVGMCQEGAKVLAEDGWDYRDILEHYYTGVQVENTEPVAMNWYFAEGTTRPGFETYLCLGNPSDVEVPVTITYILDGEGTVEASRTINPWSRITIDVTEDVGSDKDFSCRVSSAGDTGIVAERPMYFNYKGYAPGGHNTIGTPYPRTAWYFAEGTTRPGFETYLCLGNPSDKEASVLITYVRGDGTRTEQGVNVAPLSRVTVLANDVLGTIDSFGSDTAVKVESTNGVGIVAERPMYFNYKGYAPGGHNTIGR